ncbi:MAG: hypothetical protein FWE03_05890 [Firmicutes bacterium]|nr:hypothetical protein [Bacillota bacterium]
MKKRKAKLRWIKIVVVLGLFLMLLSPLPVSSPQIHMSALSLAIGIDHSEHGVKALALVYLPIVGGGPLYAGDVVEAEGQNIAEALENINILLGRRVEYMHSGILVLGKEYAQNGVINELEHLVITGTVSPTINIALATTEDTRAFLEALNEYSNRMTLTNLFKYTVSGALSHSNTLLDFIKETHSASGASMMSAFELSGGSDAGEGGITNEDDEEEEIEEEHEKKEEFSYDVESGPFGPGMVAPTELDPIALQFGEGNDRTLIKDVNNTAIFKSGKLVNIWTGEESRGIAWVDKNTTAAIVFLRQTPLKMNRKKVRVKTNIEGDKAIYNLRLDIRFSLSDLRFINNGPLLSEEEFKKIEEAASLKIESEIKRAYLASIRDEADVFLIQDTFFRRNNRGYERLKKDGFNFLNDSEFNIEVKVRIS